jgi:hypothetical protein
MANGLYSTVISAFGGYLSSRFRYMFHPQSPLLIDSFHRMLYSIYDRISKSFVRKEPAAIKRPSAQKGGRGHNMLFLEIFHGFHFFSAGDRL